MKIVNYIASILISIAILIVALAFFHEFYLVAIANDLDGYPWGEINENPFWYASPLSYWITALIFGSVFAILSVFHIYFSYKQREKTKWILSGVFVGFLALNHVLQKI